MFIEEIQLQRDKSSGWFAEDPISQGKSGPLPCFIKHNQNTMQGTATVNPYK